MTTAKKKHSVVILMIVLMGLLGMAPRVDAGFVPSRATLPDDRSRQDSAAIERVLEDKVIQQRLADFGLSQEEIQSRIDRLTAEERHQLALQIDQLAPAGSTTGTVIIVLLAILVVLGIMNLFGKHVVITK